MSLSTVLMSGYIKFKSIERKMREGAMKGTQIGSVSMVLKIINSGALLSSVLTLSFCCSLNP